MDERSFSRALAKVVAPVIREYVAVELDPLRADVRTIKATLDSFERRLSRHADHLANLESKLKALR